MDERQSQIKEGAGLEESRINEELIEFLNKWSFPVLLVIAIISGGYFVKNKYEQRKIARRDAAFAQLGAVEATQSPSIVSLTAIADEFQGVGSVAELARLKAADMHMRAVRSGVDPADDTTVLSDDDRKFHLEKAEGLYRSVLDAVKDDAAKALLAANAAFGLASVAESRGDADTARSEYEQAKAYASQSGYTPLASVADEMIASLSDAPPAPLPSKADLPTMPYEQTPEAAPATTPAEPGADVPATEAPMPEAPGADVPVPPAEGGADAPKPDDQPAPPPAEPASDPGDG